MTAIEPAILVPAHVMASVEIPNRSLFKAPEVCEIAQLQPYVLRSWEAEFPDLGVTRAGNRVYRRHDVERVLRLKHLLFVEGLTLAGARKRIEEESAPLPALEDGEENGTRARPAGPNGDHALRRQLMAVRHELRSILAVLDRDRRAAEAPPFQLQAEPVPVARAAVAGRRQPTKPSPHAGRAAKSSSPPRRSR